MGKGIKTQLLCSIFIINLWPNAEKITVKLSSVEILQNICFLVYDLMENRMRSYTILRICSWKISSVLIVFFSFWKIVCDWILRKHSQWHTISKKCCYDVVLTFGRHVPALDIFPVGTQRFLDVLITSNSSFQKRCH